MKRDSEARRQLSRKLELRGQVMLVKANAEEGTECKSTQGAGYLKRSINVHWVFCQTLCLGFQEHLQSLLLSPTGLRRLGFLFQIPRWVESWDLQSHLWGFQFIVNIVSWYFSLPAWFFALLCGGEDLAAWTCQRVPLPSSALFQELDSQL